jgi:hypothetical protein
LCSFAAELFSCRRPCPVECRAYSTGVNGKGKIGYLCVLLARLNSLSFYVLYTLFKNTKNENIYIGFTRNLKLRFEQHEKALVEVKNLEDL